MPKSPEFSSISNDEPVFASVTDFVIEHIDNYDELNPEKSWMRDESFRQALKNALTEIETFSGDEPIECAFYKVHRNVEIDGKKMGFIFKILKPDSPEPFGQIEEEYEIFQHYCPDISLPTIFLTGKIGKDNPDTYEVAIQKDIEGLTIDQYIMQHGKFTPEIKQQLDQLESGMRDLFEKERLVVDGKTINPIHDNVLIDPADGHVWIVDTNRIFRQNDLERAKEYISELDHLRQYIEDNS